MSSLKLQMVLWRQVTRYSSADPRRPRMAVNSVIRWQWARLEIVKGWPSVPEPFYPFFLLEYKCIVGVNNSQLLPGQFNGDLKLLFGGPV